MNLKSRDGAIECVKHIVSLSKKLQMAQNYELEAHAQIHSHNMSFLRSQHFLQTLQMDQTHQKFTDIVSAFDKKRENSTRSPLSIHKSSVVIDQQPLQETTIRQACLNKETQSTIDNNSLSSKQNQTPRRGMLRRLFKFQK